MPSATIDAIPILSSEGAARVDARAIQEVGIPGHVLMENAGRAVFRVLLKMLDRSSGPAVVVCGPGNNGGDGFVVSRYLLARRRPQKVYVLGAGDRISGDAALNLGILRTLDVPVTTIQDDSGLELLKADLAGAGVVLDALFGTGLSRPLEGLSAAVVEAINASPAPVVAVDIPSGVNATYGHVLGVAIDAHTTVTFGYPKLGHLLYPGASHCGRLMVADIGFPRHLAREEQGVAFLTTVRWVARMLPSRPEFAHKGMVGRVCVIGGSEGFTGAPIMAGDAALRTGAGLCTLCVPDAILRSVQARVRECMTWPLPDSGRGYLGLEALSRIQDLIQGAAAVAIGPGLGRHASSMDLVLALLDELGTGDKGPALVLDADALHALPRWSPDEKAARRVVLTPHAGEMAAMLESTIDEVRRHPLQSARQAALRFGSVVVMKGAHSIIAWPDGRAFINPTGNEGMATGGMGDALTGVLAALLAQGMQPGPAAAAGVFLHGLAGDLATQHVGSRGILTRDVIRRIPTAIESVLQQRVEVRYPYAMPI